MGSQGDAPILIIGGGTCGLAIAQGLKKNKIPYTLFERDSAEDYWNKTRDWGMLLHWGKDFLLSVLSPDLVARFSECLVDPVYDGSQDIAIPHVNGATGEVLADVEMPGMVRVSRKKLRSFLTSTNDLNIEFNKRLVSVWVQDGETLAVFDDGSAHRGRLVVGCDGSRSKVREFLVGPETAKPVDTGMTIINHVASCYTAEEAVLLRKYSPVSTCFYDPQVDGIFLLTILDASRGDRPETWSFQLHHAWWGAPTAKDFSTPKARLDFFKDRCSRLCEPFATAARVLPDNTVLPVDPGQQWSPIAWDNHHGSVTIAGDAAHSMLPNRGQGLNNAMQDAAGIVRALESVKSGEKTLEEVITAYETNMRPRGAGDVALSLETAKKLRVTELLDSPMFKLGLHKIDGGKAAAMPWTV